MTDHERLFRAREGIFEALNRVYPDGAGLDMEYWLQCRLWMICEAAAIIKGIDPRVLIERMNDADRRPPSAPHWYITWIPGYERLMNELYIMARNGAITRYLDGVNDHEPMFWCVDPNQIRSLYGLNTHIKPEVKATSSWERLSIEQKKSVWQAMSPEERRLKASELVKKHNGNLSAAGREVGITGRRIGQLLKETEPEGESEAPLPINKYTAALGLSKPAPRKPSR